MTAPPGASGIGDPVGTPQQEVTRERDALDVEPRAPRHLDVDHAQRDRNAEPAFDDEVQEAVAEVVVVVVVAREVLVFVEKLVERGNPGADGRLAPGPESHGGTVA